MEERKETSTAAPAAAAPHTPSPSYTPHAPHSSSHGPHSSSSPRPPRPDGERGPGGGRFRRPRRKSCRFCAEKIVAIDYKDFNRLRSFVSERGKIVPSRMTGTCASHQRELTQAINRARNIALLPFAHN
jgi:small subunit ribosomal protein S18